MFHSTNPFTGERIKDFSFDTVVDLKNKLQLTDESQKEWSLFSVSDRALQVKNVGIVLNTQKNKLAALITSEMGKPITESLAEIEKCIDLCTFYSESGPNMLLPKKGTTSFESYITYEPIGVILGIMPWNFPFWQVFRFVIPTLLAGNTVIVKHALNVPECALAIASVFNETITCENVYTNIFTPNKKTENLIANPIIKGVSLTGSVKAGRVIAAAAGKEIKPVVLELGGSNALIVFKDADIEKAITSCIHSRFQNNGQSCIATKRLLLDESIQTEFMEKLLIKVAALKTGDPMDPITQHSVLAKQEFVEHLSNQLKRSVERGAQIVLGGTSNGTYFDPTVVTNVTADMPLFNEETFGPILSVTTFKTENEAIRLANETEFGLGVSLFSENIERMKTIAFQFRDAAVFINSFVQSIPQLPFGGSKVSGLGRELAEEGVKAFVNIKTHVVL